MKIGNYNKPVNRQLQYKTKENIYSRIKKSSNFIINKVKTENIYGFQLITELYNIVDNDFKDISDKKQDIIIMRLWDNLDRNINKKLM
jgi:hypothetical protein